MIINRSFKDFKFRHRSKKNQIIYTSKKVKNDEEVLNLIDNFLKKKIVLFLSLLKKVKLKVDILFLVKILIKFGNLIIIILI
jgi:anthranilate synthase component 1